MKKHELKNIELFEEKGQYYLKLKYLLEDDHAVEELEIPRVEIPFNANHYPELISYEELGGCRITSPTRACRLNVGSSLKELPLHLDKTSSSSGFRVFYTVNTIKEKRKEMTVSEIEKMLGYKIKIVAEG
jgi:hypothetical protein